jgi:hypothetical protein
MIGLTNALGVESAQLAEDISSPLEVGDDDFLGVGIDRGAGETELFCGPQSQSCCAGRLP